MEGHLGRGKCTLSIITKFNFIVKKQIKINFHQLRNTFKTQRAQRLIIVRNES